MIELNIDIETKSSGDLKNYGVYKYVDAFDFDILIFSCSFNDADNIITFDLTRENLPAWVIAYILDKNILKTAHNAQFERVCMSYYLRRLGYLRPGEYLDPAGWDCTAVLAARAGLPRSLDGASRALGVDQKKDAEGKKLIQFFSIPQTPNLKNRFTVWNDPAAYPEKFAKYIEYNRQDVRTEISLRRALLPVVSNFEVLEHEAYVLDQLINDRGVRIDKEFSNLAREVADAHKEVLIEELRALTGLKNPESQSQFLTWCALYGAQITSTGAEILEEYLERDDVPRDVRRAIEIRLLTNKTSLSKYATMIGAALENERLSGSILFYGAARTGRFAGRIFQPHNLPRMHLEDQGPKGSTVDGPTFVKSIRDLIKLQNVEAIELIYGDTIDVICQMIRTAIIPAPGAEFVVADFSAIEARVIAWLAGETWRNEAFSRGADIYVESAALMYNVPAESIKGVTGHGPNYKLRALGKVAELALGYQGGAGALAKMDSKKEIPENQYNEIKTKWRAASPNIVRFWYALQDSAIAAIENPGEVMHVRCAAPISYVVTNGVLKCTLPSGRSLYYQRPRIVPGEYGPRIIYSGENDKAGAVFMDLDLYGGKQAENIVQAVARDLLVEAMLRAERAGFPLVFHVHDEIIAETPIGRKSLKELCDIMAQVPAWATGIVLNAEGFVAPFYMKG